MYRYARCIGMSDALEFLRVCVTAVDAVISIMIIVFGLGLLYIVVFWIIIPALIKVVLVHV
jgi:hypothetical protein